MNQPETNYKYLGKGHKLVEGLEKITGRAQYAGDIRLTGMLYARIILSPYAHARIVSIDKREAEQMPGVIAILTAADLPTKDQTIASRNSAVLAKEKVLFRGQPVAVVVAESESAAQDAMGLVIVDYDPLPVVIDPIKAMRDESPSVWPEGLPTEDSDLSAAHSAMDAEGEKEGQTINNVYASDHFERGDIAQGFSEANVIVERTYTMASVHQSYLEPHTVVAEPDPFRGSLTIYTSTQGQFMVRNEVSRILALPKRKIRIVAMTLGGGFGAKYGILDPLAGAIALTLKRPIQVVLTRAEDFLTTTPSPRIIITLKTGAKNDGTLTALKAKIVVDNGIFGFPLAGLVGTLIGGYYKFTNTCIDGYEVNTHKPQIGAYRAPGAPQASFALEANMDDMANQLGKDPLEFRLQNAVETGDPMGNNDPWPNLGLKQCLERMKEHPAWKNRNTRANEGIGLAIGGWPSFMGPASAVCRVEGDGVVRIHVGSVDISGVNSSFVLVAAEILGVSPDEVEIIQGDTLSGPFAPHSGGSQVTYSVAGAVSGAAQQAKQKLLQLASDHFESSVDDLVLKESKVQVRGVPDRAIAIGELGQIAQSKAGGPGPIVGQGQTAIEENAPGFAVHLVKVVVDPDTGQVQPTHYVAVHDVGFALNPTMVEGQIHGGVVQGIGMGLHEALIYDEVGQLLTGSFMDYDIPKIDTVPTIETVLVYNPSPTGPFGVRGIGEPPIIPGAVALANAIKDATGIRLSELPIRSEHLWQAMDDNGRKGDSLKI